ncbi:MAG: hypothetical protein ACRDV4_03285 [Acidimicrobiales bacterium]
MTQDVDRPTTNGETATAAQGEPTKELQLGGPEDPSRSYNPHRPLPPPARQRVTGLQMLVVVVIAAALVVGAVLTILHFVNPAGQLDGSVQPADQLALNFPSSGVVQHMYVRPGEHVTTGEVLATHDPLATQLTVEADKASLVADDDKLTAAQEAYGLTQEQQSLAVTVADEQAVTNAQSLNNTIGTTTSTLAAAQQRLTAAQQQQSQDEQAAAGCPPSGMQSTSCTQLLAQASTDTNEVSQDSLAVQSARDTLSRLQSLVSQTSELGNSQVALAQAKAQGATDATQQSALVSSDQAAVAQDQAKVAQDDQTLTQETLVAPMNGVVGEVGGSVGEIAASDGVRNYSGPTGQGQSGTQPNLLPSSLGSNDQTGQSQFSPLVTMYSTNRWTVIVQVGEDQVIKLHPGQEVQAQLPALSSAWRGAKVGYLESVPVSGVGAAVGSGQPASYYVSIDLGDPPSNILPGMSAKVLLSAPDGTKRSSDDPGRGGSHAAVPYLYGKAESDWVAGNVGKVPNLSPAVAADVKEALNQELVRMGSAAESYHYGVPTPGVAVVSSPSGKTVARLTGLEA